MLLTDTACDSPVVLCVEDEQKYLADVGRSRDKRAIKIRRAIQPGDRV